MGNVVSLFKHREEEVKFETVDQSGRFMADYDWFEFHSERNYRVRVAGEGESLPLDALVFVSRDGKKKWACLGSPQMLVELVMLTSDEYTPELMDSWVADIMDCAGHEMGSLRQGWEGIDERARSTVVR